MTAPPASPALFSSRSDPAVPTPPPQIVRVHADDNVAVAVTDLAAGTPVPGPEGGLILIEDIPAGHKLALRDLAAGEAVVKYGHPIGSLTAPCPAGGWVHSHNLRTDLGEVLAYRYAPITAPGAVRSAEASFLGYRRADGRVGTRNELWVLNTVACVNHAAERIAAACRERFGDRIDGAYSFSHPYGCSQLGDDLANTRRVLAGLMRHPNAGGVLVIGLGCENNQLKDLIAAAGTGSEARLRYFSAQDVEDEVEAGVAAAAEIVELMAADRRTPCPASDLVIGVKCGGSDGFSGLTANAVVGRVTDRLTALGGTAILTEVPEMFGAEQLLMNRAADQTVFEATAAMVNRFKDYFVRHDQPIYENPSPGNKSGGLTTLEEKSLGAVQKGGQATVTQVLRYGEPVCGPGLALLEAPGNDGVSSTAQVASGATILLFTTGRGTPLGFPAPTLKIASNSGVAERKPGWIDFDAGALLHGMAPEKMTDALFELILRTASGEVSTRNELNGIREIAIWKNGVTL